MYKCNYCKRKFKTKQQRSGHMRVHSKKSRSGEEVKALKQCSFKKHQFFVDQYKESPLKCGHCSSIIPYEKAIKRRSDKKFLKTKNIFCNSSCAATFNNTHKTNGIRRSKLEVWLEQKLNNIYPKLKIYYCRKDAINSELDIFIPSLNLAFELNGIFHYEPIYGDKVLKNIKNNDNRKFQACLEQNIELCIINTSSLKYFKESNATPYLKIIQNIIENKLPCGDSNRD